MAYTLSFDASPKAKVKASGVKGYIHHFARDVDKKNGRETNHSNKNIDPNRTADNSTYILVPGKGHRKCKDSKEIEKALAERLSHVKKPLRKDAVVIRPLVVQIDPEWYKDNPDANHMEIIKASKSWIEGRFGKDNMATVQNSPNHAIIVSRQIWKGR